MQTVIIYKLKNENKRVEVMMTESAKSVFKYLKDTFNHKESELEFLKVTMNKGE